MPESKWAAESFGLSRSVAGWYSFPAVTLKHCVPFSGNPMFDSRAYQHEYQAPEKNSWDATGSALPLAIPRRKPAEPDVVLVRKGE
jgi:hypothetical protein